MDGNNMNRQNATHTQTYANSAYTQAQVQNKPGKGPGITSMVLGIVALITTLISCCLPFGYLLAALLGLLSIIFGIVAIAKKRGKDMGVAGIICSVVGLLFAIVYFVFTLLIGAGMIAAPAFMLEYMEESGYMDEYYEYEYDYDNWDDYDDWDMDSGYDGDYNIYDENGEIDWDEVEDIINSTDWDALEDAMNEVDWEEMENALDEVDWEAVEEAVNEADWEQLEEDFSEVDWEAVEDALDEVDWEAVEEMMNEEN